MGEKVQVTPPERASVAARRARSSTSVGSNVAAIASGTGAMVRWPWMTSSPMRSGMPSRVCSTASRCSAFVAVADRGQNIAPIPSRTSAAASSSRGRKTICSCPSFSSQVISLMKRRTRGLLMSSFSLGAVDGTKCRSPGTGIPGLRPDVGDYSPQAASISSST